MLSRGSLSTPWNGPERIWISGAFQPHFTPHFDPVLTPFYRRKTPRSSSRPSTEAGSYIVSDRPTDDGEGSWTGGDWSDDEFARDPMWCDPFALSTPCQRHFNAILTPFQVRPFQLYDGGVGQETTAALGYLCLLTGSASEGSRERARGLPRRLTRGSTRDQGPPRSKGGTPSQN